MARMSGLSVKCLPRAARHQRDEAARYGGFSGYAEKASYDMRSAHTAEEKTKLSHEQTGDRALAAKRKGHMPRKHRHSRKMRPT